MNKTRDKPLAEGQQTEWTLEIEMDSLDPQLYVEPPHRLRGLPLEVIFETQFSLNKKNKGSVYNDIMPSIGLDISTNSREERSKHYNRSCLL